MRQTLFGEWGTAATRSEEKTVKHKLRNILCMYANVACYRMQYSNFREIQKEKFGGTDGRTRSSGYSAINMRMQYFDKNSTHLFQATAPLAMARSTASGNAPGALSGKVRLFITAAGYAAQI